MRTRTPTCTKLNVFRSHPLPPAPVTDELWPAREPTGATSNSERLRSAPRTCRSLRGRLSMRETHRMGWDQTHVSHETPRVHIAPERRGSRVAARRARAASGQAAYDRFFWAQPHLPINPPIDRPRVRQRGLAPSGRKDDCLEGHPTWIGTEFLTQSLRQGVNDSIRINAAARPDLVN